MQDSRFYFNYHHTAADTFDKVNPQLLGENAAVMAVVGLCAGRRLHPRSALDFQHPYQKRPCTPGNFTLDYLLP